MHLKSRKQPALLGHLSLRKRGIPPCLNILAHPFLERKDGGRGWYLIIFYVVFFPIPPFQAWNMSQELFLLFLVVSNLGFFVSGKMGISKKKKGIWELVMQEEGVMLCGLVQIPVVSNEMWNLFMRVIYKY